jgi:F-type H+-transporting ATPase subunit b
MDEILRQLGGLALGAIPTVIILFFLYVSYRFLVHAPLSRVLTERENRTTGAVAKAQADIAAAEHKTTEYEQRIREARLTIFKKQEARRSQLMQARMKAVAEARTAAQVMVQNARTQLEKESVAAKAKLQAEGASLAEEIIRILLGRRVQERTPAVGRR